MFPSGLGKAQAYTAVVLCIFKGDIPTCRASLVSGTGRGPIPKFSLPSLDTYLFYRTRSR